MGCISLDRLDEIRDKICSSLELDIDISSRVIDLYIEIDEIIVGEDSSDDDDGDDDKTDKHENLLQDKNSLTLISTDYREKVYCMQ